MDIYKSRHDPKSRESTAFDWDSIIAFHQADEYMSHCQMLGKFEYTLPAKF